MRTKPQPTARHLSPAGAILAACLALALSAGLQCDSREPALGWPAPERPSQAAPLAADEDEQPPEPKSQEPRSGGQQRQGADQRPDNELDNEILSQSKGQGVQTTELERRLDRLEFELRKSVHQWTSTAASATSGSSNEQLARQVQRLEAKWDSLMGRLDLMEKFISSTSHKLYDGETRIKLLERCECRQPCKWAPTERNSSLAASSPAPAHELKMDGSSWQSNCDLCSCHRGQVRCKTIACPEVRCSDPHHERGKCCPVCYKPCSYKSQTIRHGNKLVINSNQDSCKECVCLDGRLKCQRVELPTFGRQQRAVSITSALDIDYNEELEELADELLGAEDLRLSANRKSRSASLQPGQWAPLAVCPQIDCPKEQQFRLKNDCCTYCAGFDFCAHFRLQCHPNAECHNSMAGLNDSTASQTTMEATSRLLDEIREAPIVVASMFRCQCKAGFVGDGRRMCRDLDECASPATNQCQTNSTRCVNTQGSYLCQCRPGYRPVGGGQPSAGDQLSHSTGASLEQAAGELEGGPRLQHPASLGCLDVDECADGKLNRCHPHARCVNKPGGYKCHCRRGYLGNGFDCHQWFSSEPHVAAYLLRHSPPTNESGRQPATVHQPLIGLASGQDLDQLSSFYDDQNLDKPSVKEVEDALATTSSLPADKAEAAPLRWSRPQQQEPAEPSAPPLTGSPGERRWPEPNTRTMYLQPPPSRAGLWLTRNSSGPPRAEPSTMPPAPTTEATTPTSVSAPSTAAQTTTTTTTTTSAASTSGPSTSQQSDARQPQEAGSSQRASADGSIISVASDDRASLKRGAANGAYQAGSPATAAAPTATANSWSRAANDDSGRLIQVTSSTGPNLRADRHHQTNRHSNALGVTSGAVGSLHGPPTRQIDQPINQIFHLYKLQYPILILFTNLVYLGTLNYNPFNHVVAFYFD